MKKSVSKRLTFTKNGKIVCRPTGVDHFKTTKTSKTRRMKTKTRTLKHSRRAIVRY